MSKVNNSISSEGLRKRRCIIKKLDFENCIVTNIKTKARGRKKLRARITREIEDYSDLSEDISACGQLLETSLQTDSQVQTSPVLTRKIPDGRSPVFFKKAKNIFDKAEKLAATGPVDAAPSPSSPVFKFFKKSKILNDSPNQCQDSTETFANAPCSNEEESSSELESGYQIDDATTQESKESIKISSVESTSIMTRSSSTISAVSTILTRRNVSGELMSNSFIAEKCVSPRQSRRNYKKNSLLGRLHKLQQKQASEKLLWQHQNRRNSSSSLKFSVVTFWKEESNFFLKCRSLSKNLAVTFIVVDSRWAPQLKNVKENSILQIHPPWQKVTVEELNKTVLINVICLDILDEKGNFIAEKKTRELIPAEKFETQEKLFIDSLFCSSPYGFLC